MKKIILVILSLLLIFNVKADEINLSDYNTETLEEVFKSEGINTDLSSYKESDDKVNIYLFRGKGCPHCSDFINYVNNTLLKKYSDYFNLISFETWYDENNATLLNQVGEFFNYDTNSQQFGIPFIIIGDKTFVGYSDSYNSQIEEEIVKLYKSKDKYDVFKEMANPSNKTEPLSSTFIIVFFNFIISSILCFILLKNSNKNKLKILNELELLKKNMKK